MLLLSISLLIFSGIILLCVILGVIWWKKYGKSTFSAFNDLKNMQNPSNMGNFDINSFKNLNKMVNFSVFNRNLSQIKDLLSRNPKK
jgi:hypothetical protein